MDELACAECNADVRRAAADGLEEQQIPGPDLVPVDPFAFVILLSRFAGKRCAVPGKHPLDEPAAIEPAVWAHCLRSNTVSLEGPSPWQSVLRQQPVSCSVGLGVGKGRGLGTLPLDAHPPTMADAKSRGMSQRARIVMAPDSVSS